MLFSCHRLRRGWLLIFCPASSGIRGDAKCDHMDLFFLHVGASTMEEVVLTTAVTYLCLISAKTRPLTKLHFDLPPREHREGENERAEFAENK